MVGDTAPGLAGSAYERLAGAAPEDGPPPLDLARETAVQAFIREAIARGLVESCQDVSGGGLAVALAEMAIWGDVGATLRVGVGDSPAVALFGESPSRLVVRGRSRATSRRSSCSPASTGSRSTPWARPAARGSSSSSPATGATGAAEERGSRIADALEVPLADLRHAWDHGLPRALGWEGDGSADHVADAALPGTEVRA